MTGPADDTVPPQPPASGAYPSALAHQATLPDGTSILVRPIRPEDESALTELVARSTPEDIRSRFFVPLRELPHELAARLSHIDYTRDMAFVATSDPAAPGGEILGVGRLLAEPGTERAEYAIMVRSDQKGRGIGYLLMGDLIAHARRRGIRTVFGEVLRENATMLQMVREYGFAIGPGEDPSIVQVSIDVAGAATPPLPG